MRGSLAPFVVEATGRLGNRAKAFLSVMISRDETFLLSQFYNALSSLVTLFNTLMYAKESVLKLASLETNNCVLGPVQWLN